MKSFVAHRTQPSSDLVQSRFGDKRESISSTLIFSALFHAEAGGTEYAFTRCLSALYLYLRPGNVQETSRPLLLERVEPLLLPEFEIDER